MEKRRLHDVCRLVVVVNEAISESIQGLLISFDEDIKVCPPSGERSKNELRVVQCRSRFHVGIALGSGTTCGTRNGLTGIRP